MEPEVHIIEKYFQEAKHCFTMTNIKCKSGREIDLLAINPLTGEKYHVESKVWLGKKFRVKDINSLAKEKFEHPIVKEKIQKFFRDSKYRKWLVIQPQKVDFQLDDFAREKYGIEIQYIEVFLRMMMRKLSFKGSRDHVLRTLELFRIIREFDRTHVSKIRIQKPRALA